MLWFYIICQYQNSRKCKFQRYFCWQEKHVDIFWWLVFLWACHLRPGLLLGRCSPLPLRQHTSRKSVGMFHPAVQSTELPLPFSMWYLGRICKLRYGLTLVFRKYFHSFDPPIRLIQNSIQTHRWQWPSKGWWPTWAWPGTVQKHGWSERGSSKK